MNIPNNDIQFFKKLSAIVLLLVFSCCLSCLVLQLWGCCYGKRVARFQEVSVPVVHITRMFTDKDQNLYDLFHSDYHSEIDRWMDQTHVVPECKSGINNEEFGAILVGSHYRCNTENGNYYFIFLDLAQDGLLDSTLPFDSQIGVYKWIELKDSRGFCSKVMLSENEIEFSQDCSDE